MRDIFAGLIAVELDSVDEAFVKKVFGERKGIVHENADARDLAGEGGEKFARGRRWAIAFRFFPKIDADGVDAKAGEFGGFVGAGDAADFEGGASLAEKGHGFITIENR